MKYAAQRAWKQRNKEKVAEYNATFLRNSARRYRAMILKEFGPCNHCGFDDYRALQVDHVNGGGAKDRGKRGQTTASLVMYINLRARFLVGELQILCANCNWIKRFENGEHNKRLL